MKCNDQRLAELIGSDEPLGDDASLELSQHLASCQRCQQAMTNMAAPDGWWAEASTVLDEESEYRSTIIISLESSMSEDVDVQADEVSLDFLEPPSHPEMLGRLGRYEIERVIGMGGMGIVLKAFDTELNRPVAIKVLAPHLSHSGAARRRFAREAQAAAAVIHENVIPIHDVQDTSELPYLVMQYVPGESLQARVDRDGPLSIEEVLRISNQVAAGLAAAHALGLVHRDVKPANILLQDGVDRVTISDFGLARTVDDASLTRTGIVAGTPHYMSPEQARGTTIDCRSDQFGLGSVMYFMCTGHPPFRADGAMAVLNRICHDPHRPVDEVNPRVPTVISDIIDRLMAKSPEGRFTSTDQINEQLAAALSDWRKPARRRNMQSTRRRNPLRRALSVVIVVASLLLLAKLIGEPVFNYATILTTEPTSDNDRRHSDAETTIPPTRQQSPDANVSQLFVEGDVLTPPVQPQQFEDAQTNTNLYATFLSTTSDKLGSEIVVLEAETSHAELENRSSELGDFVGFDAQEYEEWEQAVQEIAAEIDAIEASQNLKGESNEIQATTPW